MNKKVVLKVIPFVLLFFMLFNFGISFEIERQQNLLENNIDSTGGCFSSGGCGTVAASKYSSVLGVKTTFIGMFGFSIMAILLFFLIWNNRNYLDLLISFGMVIGSFGAFSFIFIQHHYIGAYCIYCLVVDSIMILSGLIWLWYYRNK